MWKEAAALEVMPVDLRWEKFPWQKAIFHFTRLIGFIHSANSPAANSELDSLKILHQILSAQKEKQKEAMQVAVQIKSGEAWIEYNNGSHEKALQSMTAAAVLEDNMEKHPVTPGEVIPASELLAEMMV